jgi:hypothetical protein
MSTKYVYQHFPILAPPKFTQIGLFGWKINQSGKPASKQIPFQQLPRNTNMCKGDRQPDSGPGLPDGIFLNQKS